MPRRKPGTLLPIELDILETTLALRRSDHTDVHGYALAHALRDASGSRALTAHGTLYKALGRLEELGLLTSRWEDEATVQGRPRRRLYRLSERGAEAAASVGAERAIERVPRIAASPA